jgi:transposase-like protein
VGIRRPQAQSAAEQAPQVASIWRPIHHPNQITQWKAQLSESAANVFGPGGTATTQPSVDVKGLHAKIGELTLENDFLEGALTKAGLLSARR